MEHRVTVDFTGLCVFVTKNVPERLSVILAADPKGGMRHRPILSFNVRNAGAFSAASVDQVIQLPDGSQIASWRLDKRIVRLKGGRGAHPGKIVLCGGGAPKARCPQDPVSEMDLSWVPSLKRVCGEGKVDPVYLSDNPVPHHGKSALAARVDLDCGYLYANAEVNRQAPAEFWTFSDGTGPGVAQYLADTVRLEMIASPDVPVVVEVSRFGGGSTETLELHPWNDRIEMAITNLPNAMPSHGGHATSMPHFGIYYELLDPAPQHKPIPSRLEGSTCREQPATAAPMSVVEVGIQGVHPVKCTPGMVP